MARRSSRPPGQYRGKKGVRGKTYYWRRVTCPHCGARYRDLRTGWTWRDAQGIARRDHEQKRRSHYSRGTVLGIWFAFKQQLWNQHLEECEMQSRYDEWRAQS